MDVQTRAANLSTSSPSGLLRHLTGDMAAAIAAIWPAPHAAFLAAPAERRHLASLAIARGAPFDPDLVVHANLRAAIGSVFPHPPPGLRRALGRLGEPAWRREDYLVLWDQLAHPPASKVLRHLEAITPRQVRTLAVLPGPMKRARFLEMVEIEGALLILACQIALLHRNGGEAMWRATCRWAEAESYEGLANAIRRDLLGEPADPGLRVSTRLRRLATQADMREAALRYRNCLEERLSEAGAGTHAFYEWTGEPGLVVELARDPIFGWSLACARGADNAPTPAAAREPLSAALRSMGVHVGVQALDLYHGLDAARFRFEWIDEALFGSA